jgi:hypothetical protein
MTIRGSGIVIAVYRSCYGVFLQWAGLYAKGERDMDEIANAVAILLDEIEDHHGEITDREVARRVAIVRVQLEELQLQLDPSAQLTL